MPKVSKKKQMECYKWLVPKANEFINYALKNKDNYEVDLELFQIFNSEEFDQKNVDISIRDAKTGKFLFYLEQTADYSCIIFYSNAKCGIWNMWSNRDEYIPAMVSTDEYEENTYKENAVVTVSDFEEAFQEFVSERKAHDGGYRLYAL